MTEKKDDEIKNEELMSCNKLCSCEKKQDIYIYIYLNAIIQQKTYFFLIPMLEQQILLISKKF